MIIIVCSVLLIVVGFVLALMGVKSRIYRNIQIGVCLASVGFILTNYSSTSFILAVLTLGGGLALLLKTVLFQANNVKVPGLVLCLAGVVLGILSQTVFSHGVNGKSIKNQDSYDLIEAEYLGKYVQENYAGKRVGVLLDYSLDGDDYVPPIFQEYLGAFQQGLGREVDVIKHLPVLYRISTASGEAQEVVDDNKIHSFDVVGETMRNMGADVILNLHGFPCEKNKQPAENAKLFEELISDVKATLVVPIGYVSGDYLSKVTDAIEDGRFVTVLLKKGRRKSKDSIPNDLDEAFQGYFVLVSKESVKGLCASGDYSSFLPNTEEEKDSDETEEND